MFQQKYIISNEYFNVLDVVRINFTQIIVSTLLLILIEEFYVWVTLIYHRYVCTIAD